MNYKVSMPKNPKCDDGEEKGTWSEDQKERDYYYDDAHGYEEYEPESDEDNGDGEASEPAVPKERLNADVHHLPRLLS